MTAFCYKCKEQTCELVLAEYDFTVGKGKFRVTACSECGRITQTNHPEEPLHYISIEGKLEL